MLCSKELLLQLRKHGFRELPLAIAKDFDFENIFSHFAYKKARKVFFRKNVMRCLICLS